MNQDGGQNSKKQTPQSAEDILYGHFAATAKSMVGQHRWVKEIDTSWLGLTNGLFENIHTGWSGTGALWMAKAVSLTALQLEAEKPEYNMHVVEMQLGYLELMLRQYDKEPGTGHFTDFKYGIDRGRRTASIGPYQIDLDGSSRQILTGESFIVSLDHLAAVEKLTTDKGSWSFYHHGAPDDFHYYRELVYIYDGNVIGSVNVEVPDDS